MYLAILQRYARQSVSGVSKKIDAPERHTRDWNALTHDQDGNAPGLLLAEHW